MSRNAREGLRSPFFHVMVQGVNREYIFNSKFYKKKYLEILKETIPKFNINIIAYCVMSNHTHLLINSQEILEISNFMHKINTTYAILYNSMNNRVGHLFRDRFKSQPIKDLSQLYCCINYIHNNPVKASICSKNEEYEFSSYREYLNQPQIVNEKILKQYLGNGYLDELRKINDVDEFTFIEDEIDKKAICQNIINEYLNKNDMSFESLKHNKDKLIDLGIMLKKNDISYRIMEEMLGIGRETIRKQIIKKYGTTK